MILFSSLLLILLIDLISPKMLEENFERQSGKILSEVFTASGMNLTSDCILSLVQSSMLELKHLILRRAFLEIGLVIETVSHIWEHAFDALSER